MKWEKLKEEIVDTIPAVIFFIVAFTLIHFTEDLMIGPQGVRYYNYFAVVVGGLVVGKFLIIINYFSFVNMFPGKPLMYNIVWKTFIYTVFSFLFRVVEHYIHMTIKFHSAAYAFDHMNAELGSPVFWAIQCWLLALFLLYNIGHEFTEKVGRKKVREMMLG